MFELVEEDAASDAAPDDEVGLHERNDEERLVHAEGLSEAEEPKEPEAAHERRLHPEEPAGDRERFATRHELDQLGEALALHDHLRAAEQRRGDGVQHRQIDLRVLHREPRRPPRPKALVRDKGGGGDAGRHRQKDPPPPAIREGPIPDELLLCEAEVTALTKVDGQSDTHHHREHAEQHARRNLHLAHELAKGYVGDELHSLEWHQDGGRRKCQRRKVDHRAADE